MSSTERVKKRSRRSRDEREQAKEQRQEAQRDETTQLRQEPQQKVNRRSQQRRRDKADPQPQQPTESAAVSPQPVASSPPADVEQKKKKRRRKTGRRDTAPDTATAASTASTPPSLPLPPVPAGCFKAFVGGLPYSVSEAELTAFFQRDGCFVWSVRIAQYREGHQFEKQQRGSVILTARNVLQLLTPAASSATNSSILAVKLTPLLLSLSVCCCSFAHVEFENESQVARSLQRNGELWSDGEHRITVQIAKPKRSDSSTASGDAAAAVLSV
jgi:hypothetical protein